MSRCARFRPFLGIGIDCLPDDPERAFGRHGLRLLHVGRGVRTKGLRDVVRALACLGDLEGISLTSIGGGEDIAHCWTEAKALGVADRVSFLGRLPRAEIEDHYRESDVFVFPSFRESMGGVLYEAMRWGLPVVTVDYGGPGFVTDNTCALRFADLNAGGITARYCRRDSCPLSRLRPAAGDRRGGARESRE